jgi:Big-like domain-containing protein
MLVLGGVASAQEADDTTAPTIVDRSPKDGATDVTVGTNVTATFSEEMDPATSNRDTFRLLREVNGDFSLCPYSPECLEEEFCELRHNGVLRSSRGPVLPTRATCPAEGDIAEDRGLRGATSA